MRRVQFNSSVLIISPKYIRIYCLQTVLTQKSQTKTQFFSLYSPEAIPCFLLFSASLSFLPSCILVPLFLSLFSLSLSPSPLFSLLLLSFFLYSLSLPISLSLSIFFFIKAFIYPPVFIFSILFPLNSHQVDCCPFYSFPAFTWEDGNWIWRKTLFINSLNHKKKTILRQPMGESDFNCINLIVYSAHLSPSYLWHDRTSIAMNEWSVLYIPQS